MDQSITFTIIFLVESLGEAGDAAVAVELFLALARRHVLRRQALRVRDVTAGPVLHHGCQMAIARFLES